MMPIFTFLLVGFAVCAFICFLGALSLHNSEDIVCATISGVVFVLVIGLMFGSLRLGMDTVRKQAIENGVAKYEVKIEQSTGDVKEKNFLWIIPIDKEK